MIKFFTSVIKYFTELSPSKSLKFLLSSVVVVFTVCIVFFYKRYDSLLEKQTIKTTYQFEECETKLSLATAKIDSLSKVCYDLKVEKYSQEIAQAKKLLKESEEKVIEINNLLKQKK